MSRQTKTCWCYWAESFDKLESKKEFLLLDLSLVTFETQCHVINNLLMSENLFLRVYELIKKFYYLIKKLPKDKNSIAKELSTYVEERFNGFSLVKRLGEDERRHFYRTINSVYKPVSQINQIVNCCFSKFMRSAYRVVDHKKGRNAPSTVNQC